MTVDISRNRKNLGSCASPLKPRQMPFSPFVMGITGMRLTKPLASLPEAEKQAKRLSVEASHTVEIWNLDKFMCWYFRGEKG